MCSGPISRPAEGSAVSTSYLQPRTVFRRAIHVPGPTRALTWGHNNNNFMSIAQGESVDRMKQLPYKSKKMYFFFLFGYLNINLSIHTQNPLFCLDLYISSGTFTIQLIEWFMQFLKSKKANTAKTGLLCLRVCHLCIHYLT